MRGRLWLTSAWMSVAWLSSVPSAAIVMRHDRDDASYRVLGERYPAVGRFAKTGSGTLIAPTWVLTAAHVAQAAARSGVSFEVGGHTVAVAQVIVHPQWREGGPHDVGLVRLAEAVSTVVPIPACALDPEPSDVLVLAGWGDPGNGNSGPRQSEPLLRAARNAVARVDADWIVFDFSAPPAGEDLEGISGPGDSGGPALSNTGTPCIAGVSVWGDGKGKGPGRYGSDDGYARVAPERDWISSQIAPLDSVPRPAAALEEIERLIDTAVARDDFSGAVLIERHGEIVLRKASGLAERSFAAPNRIDTKFNLGSINKLFTQISIAQLAAAGKLQLNDTVGKLLPDYPNAAVAAKVTVQQLLNHSSGMGDIFPGMRRLADNGGLRSLADYLPLFVADPLEFPPGSRRQYSNAGFVVLGLIVERLSGESYYDYVERHVFAPAGMHDTASYALDQPVLNRAVGYTTEGPAGATPHPNIYELPALGSSAGGGYSTVVDLQKLAVAMRTGKLLDASWTSWILSGMPASGPASGPAAQAVVHGRLGIAGGTAGVNAVLEIDAEDDNTLVVLANLDPPAAESLSRQIRDVLSRLP